MNTVFFVISLLLAVATTVAALLRNMHIFQLNTYRAKEQGKWIKKNYRNLLFHVLALVFAVVLCFTHHTAVLIVSAVFYLMALPMVLPLKKAKKPLVYTKRVVRLLVTAGEIIAVFVLLACLCKAYFLVPLLFFLAPLLPVIANWLNTPLEKAVQNYYINDAKKMLKACPDLTVIGITGSYGKTSVKYFLTELLKAKYNVLMTPESFNTPMGVVRTVREQLRPTHEIFVCEMGAKRVGEIKELCDIANPDYGIITAVGPQHLETFKSVDNIVKTKFELAEAVKGKGVVFLNADNELIRNNLPDQEFMTYGTDGSVDFCIGDLKVTESGTNFSITVNGEKMENLNTSLIGAHNVVNLAGAIGVASYFGVTREQIAFQLKKITAPPHRLALTKHGNVTIIDDAYNSNPSGSKAAIETLGLFDGCKILVTPGMVELGAEQDALNAKMGEYAAAVCDYIILVGEKQAKPIYEGIERAGYDMSRVKICAGVQQAIDEAYKINTDKQKIILLENDLPDNYL